MELKEQSMFWENFYSLCIKNNCKPLQVVNKLEIASGSITKWKNGTRPSEKNLRKLAEHFGVTPDYFFVDHSNTVPLPSNVRPVQTKRFPMLGNIACGEPIFAEEDHETYIDASSDIKADFCLTAKGNSMIGARIHDGDVVFIRSQPTVNNGEIAAVIIGDEATLKRWYFYPDKAKLVLSPENPSYEPLVFIGEELNSVRCIGKAICFMSTL